MPRENERFQEDWQGLAGRLSVGCEIPIRVNSCRCASKGGTFYAGTMRQAFTASRRFVPALKRLF
ncbi:hypothetical protein, partial [Mesorhizobium captivum]|uniref:hypothetical protein n=1 Tax=Mesorhizobium captivum TaxID=3072319 RepID=UPI002A245D75